MLHPIATTEFFEKLLQALCLQTILLKLVELHPFSSILSLKEVKKCTNMRHVAPGNIHGIKKVLYVFFPVGWPRAWAHPVGQGEPWQSPLPQYPPRLAINQHSGMDLHTHGGMVKRSRVGLTHNIALPHFTKTVLVSKRTHSTCA